MASIPIRFAVDILLFEGAGHALRAWPRAQVDADQWREPVRQVGSGSREWLGPR